MQRFIALAEQQDFGAGRDVIAPDRFRIVGDIAFCLIGKKGEIIFPGLCLGKTSTHSHLRRLT